MLRRQGLHLAATAVTMLAFATTTLPIAAMAEQLNVAAQTPGPTALDAGSLDLSDLVRRLRRSEALGIFAKLSLRGRLDALIFDFARFHAGRRGEAQDELKHRFDTLVADTVAMLRKDDPALSGLIAAARGGLWAIVSDPMKFAAAREGHEGDQTVASFERHGEGGA